MPTAFKNLYGNKLLFSYKLTALVTILVSLINIFFWLIGDYQNIFSGYTVNPNATMKIITSISFLIVGIIYLLKIKKIIRLFIITGLLIQLSEFSLIFFTSINPQEWRLSSSITLTMFMLTYLALYFIKVKRFKVVFLFLNSTLYIIASFGVFYYLLDMEELNNIRGFESLSWNTAILFFYECYFSF